MRDLDVSLGDPGGTTFNTGVPAWDDTLVGGCGALTSGLTSVALCAFVDAVKLLSRRDSAWSKALGLAVICVPLFISSPACKSSAAGRAGKAAPPERVPKAAAAAEAMKVVAAEKVRSPAPAEKVQKPESTRPAAAPGGPSDAAVSGDGSKHLIIWGGGAALADADRALAEWNSEKKVFEGVLGLAKGYPRVVASKDVPGLKPGFHVVVLGACAASALERPMLAIQGLRKGAYAKAGALTGASGESCPSSAEGFEALDLGRLKKGTEELSIVGFRLVHSDASPWPWSYRLILRDANGGLLGSATLENKHGEFGGCEGPDFEKKGGGFTVSLECTGPSGVGPEPEDYRLDYMYSIKDSKIERTIETTKR